jgi:selenoprotein W-related protein
MLRAAYLAQELLTSFEDELSEVALVPASGGIFEVTLDGETLATNRETKSIPDAGEVKRLLRDRIAPERRIGHE